MTWRIDSTHTRVAFAVRHIQISKVSGQFTKLDGTVDFDEAEPAHSSVEVQIEAASIDTHCGMRDTHLRSADYFDAQKYPYLTFKSKRIEVVDDRHAEIHGDLTIKNNTHPVALNVEYRGLDEWPSGGRSAGLTATAALNRQDYGFNMNSLMLGETVDITIELEIVEQAAPEPVLAGNQSNDSPEMALS